MKKCFAISLLVGLGMSTAAMAETCVSSTFERPLPGATDVELRHADVPSPRFPGIWQEGWIDGFFYRIWSSEEAILQSGRKTPAWAISVVCTDDSASCEQTIAGTPSALALETVNVIQQCLSGVGNSDQAAPVSTDIPAEQGTGILSEELTTIEAQTGQSPCGLASLPEASIGLTLQRLLVEAGGDPGPLDGLVGPRTYRALAGVLGAPASELSQAEAITALDQFLCGQN